jgi:hypothetical protein
MVERYKAALAKIAESEALRAKLGEARAETWGAPSTSRVWHVGSRTVKGFPSATLAHFEAADPPPKPAPRGVCVGLALVGWAS